MVDSDAPNSDLSMYYSATLDGPHWETVHLSHSYIKLFNTDRVAINCGGRDLVKVDLIRAVELLHSPWSLQSELSSGENGSFI